MWSTTSWVCVIFHASRGKAIQMHLGRLHVEVCPLRWADEALQKTHGGQAFQVCRLWPQLLQIRPLGPAPTETHAGVNHAEEVKRGKRSMEQTHLWRQPGEQDLPVNVIQLAWTHTHTHTETHTLTYYIYTHTHTVIRRRKKKKKKRRWRAFAAQNRVTSGSSWGWKE